MAAEVGGAWQQLRQSQLLGTDGAAPTEGAGTQLANPRGQRCDQPLDQGCIKGGGVDEEKPLAMCSCVQSPTFQEPHPSLALSTPPEGVGGSRGASSQPHPLLTLSGLRSGPGVPRAVCAGAVSPVTRSPTSPWFCESIPPPFTPPLLLPSLCPSSLSFPSQPLPSRPFLASLCAPPWARCWVHGDAGDRSLPQGRLAGKGVPRLSLPWVRDQLNIILAIAGHLFFASSCLSWGRKHG